MLAGIAGYFRAQIGEIERDDALRWYGAALAFLHVVTYLYWIDQRVVGFLHAEAEPICWPLAPDCHAQRVTVGRERPADRRDAAAPRVLRRGGGRGRAVRVEAARALGLRELDRGEHPQAGGHAAGLSPAYEPALHGVRRDL